MRVGILTREFPPDVYGGAGVHVEHLARELRRLPDPDLSVDIHCFGERRAGAHAYTAPEHIEAANPALGAMAVDVEMVAALSDCDVLHSHTWYANLAGQVAGLLYDRPHVLTAHSLEPQRPWKAEQLGGGYRLSSWIEWSAYHSATAIIAVSNGMREDVLAYYPQVDPERVYVVPNGIDTEIYRRVESGGALERHGVDPDRPTVIFVGRITRQKGVAHLVRAAARFDPQVQLVLCAGAADTPELQAEIESGVAALQAERTGVVWIHHMLERGEIIELLSHATLFVCPSVYEPLGIVNLEAMACELPVVASRVGGIPEAVQDGETGLLVPLDEARPEQFEAGLADAVNRLVRDPRRARDMGLAGRERAVREFGWDRIAARTAQIYAGLS
ncbi:MAG TPA: glycogen synthase [Mycobacteriales bacterium]|nr:glycogen synthase [Mycobacteriales bacterium]